jgi:hypothetical protein
VKTTLISALADIAAERRDAVLAFLQGLSGDELQYLAEFFGSCTLESCACSEPRERLAEQIAAFERAKRPGRTPDAAWLADQDHKLILLVEYICRSGLESMPRVLGAG